MLDSRSAAENVELLSNTQEQLINSEREAKPDMEIRGGLRDALTILFQPKHERAMSAALDIAGTLPIKKWSGQGSNIHQLSLAQNGERLLVRLDTETRGTPTKQTKEYTTVRIAPGTFPDSPQSFEELKSFALPIQVATEPAEELPTDVVGYYVLAETGIDPGKLTKAEMLQTALDQSRIFITQDKNADRFAYPGIPGNRAVMIDLFASQMPGLIDQYEKWHAVRVNQPDLVAVPA